MSPIRRIAPALLLCLAPVLVATAAEPAPAAGAEPAVAARVNGAPILQSEVEAALRQARQAEDVPAERVSELRGVILDQLVAVEVVTQAASAAGVRVEDAEVEAMLADVRRQAGGDDALRQALGLEVEDVRRQIRRGLVAQRYLEQALGAEIPVTDEEIRAYYDGHAGEFALPGRTRASHVLCAAEPGDAERRAAARGRCAALLARLQGGEDFAALAREGSDCPSREQGGDLGWFRAGQMIPEFEAALPALRDGQTTPELVETPAGFHIIRLTGREPEGRRAFDEVQAPIRQLLQFERRAEREQAHVAALVAAARIER